MSEYTLPFLIASGYARVIIDVDLTHDGGLVKSYTGIGFICAYFQPRVESNLIFDHG